MGRLGWCPPSHLLFSPWKCSYERWEGSVAGGGRRERGGVKLRDGGLDVLCFGCCYKVEKRKSSYFFPPTSPPHPTSPPPPPPPLPHTRTLSSPQQCKLDQHKHTLSTAPNPAATPPSSLSRALVRSSQPASKFDSSAGLRRRQRQTP